MTRRRIKVTQIVTRFQAGAGTVALRGAAALDPDVFDVSIIAGSGDGLLEEAASRFAVTIAPSLCAPISLVRDVQALTHITALLRATRPDVVHTHSSKAGVVGRVAAHRVGVPTVVHTYHGFPFHEFQSPLRRAAYTTIERKLAGITDQVLCVGTAVSALAVRLGLAAPEAVRTIGVPVDLSRLHVGGDTARARALLGLDARRAVVGFVGRVDYQKDPLNWVRAMGTLADRDVVAVWVGSGQLDRAAKDLVDQLGLADRVVFAGHRSDVAEVLPAFDVFAMASRYEGLPLALVEAMAAGIPVVATAVNAVTDVVSPGETGLLVPPERPDLLARAVAHLLSHPDRARKMAAAGKQVVSRRYSDAALADVLTDIYMGPAQTSTTLRPRGTGLDLDLEQVI